MVTPIIRQAGEGERRWFYGGGIHTWKVTDADSDGAFFLFEDELTQGKMTPWHRHPDSDELAYILDGEVDVNIDGKQQRVGAGGMYFVPRDTPHAFTVLSPTARLLAFQTPGASARFYWDASEPAGEQPGAVDFQRIGEVAEATGATVVLGPPPFER
jgi:quercetin dioxygenase-like cupin family protein